jgi:hypothetical protein
MTVPNGDLSNMTDAELSTIEIDFELKHFQNELDHVKTLVEEKDDAIGGSDTIPWNADAKQFISLKLPDYCKQKEVPETTFRELLQTVNNALAIKKPKGCIPPSKTKMEKLQLAAIASAKQELQAKHGPALVRYGLCSRLETDGTTIMSIIIEDIPLSMQRFSDIVVDENIQKQLRELEHAHQSKVA